jgi:hypothetical protein
MLVPAFAYTLSTPVLTVFEAEDAKVPEAAVVAVPSSASVNATLTAGMVPEVAFVLTK